MTAWLQSTLRRIGAPFRRKKLERRMEEEMRQHLARLIEDNIASGLTPTEARYAALRRFGGVDRAKELCREQRGIPWWENLARDFRHASRQLGRRRAFTAVAVLTLALGIAFNTVVFSVVSPVLRRVLPLPDAERLVTIRETVPNLPGGATGVTYADFCVWQQESRAFAGMAALILDQSTLTGLAEPELVNRARVSSALFSTLGIRPAFGRDFTADDDQPAAPPVAMLSDGLWRRRYGADPEILGKTAVLNERPHRIVGVMPAGFRFPETEEIWTPLVVRSPEATRGQHSYRSIARLKPGVTLEQAQTELAAICARLAREYPLTNAGVSVRLITLPDAAHGSWQKVCWFVLGAAGLVLAVACANVANLLLSRVLSRQREWAIRTAVGAGRRQMIRQLLLESLILSAAAGLLGGLLGWLGLKLALALAQPELPYYLRIEFDGWVIGYVAGITALSALALGVAPAWWAGRIDVQAGLKETGPKADESRSSQRLRNLLVVGEVALVVVLLSGATITGQTVRRLQRTSPGFEPRDLHGFHIVALPPSRYAQPTAQAAFYRLLCERLGAVPGVQAVAAGAPVPLQPLVGSQSSNPVAIEGQPAPEPGREPYAEFTAVTPGFFATLEIPLLLGREFSTADNAEGRPVVVVDAAFARRFFGDENPLGRRLRFDPSNRNQPWREIVGVAADVKRYGLTGWPDSPGFFVPHAQVPRAKMSVLLRTDGREAAGVMAAARRALRELDGAVAPFQPFAMEESVRRSFWLNTLLGQLLAAMSALGLALAAVGIAGVVAYNVAQRTHEIGVRLALGAQAGDVRRLVVRQGLRPAAIGLLLGLAMSLTMAEVPATRIYLHALGPDELLALSASVLGFGGVAWLACYFPARRATRVDPLTALRAE